MSLIVQRPRLAGALLTLLLAAAFLGGCSKGTSVLLVSFLNIGAGPTPPPGDGNVDWDDELRTPGGVSPIAIGIKSAKLTGAGVADYFIIEDRGVNNPLIVRPPTGGDGEIFATNSDDLPNGTYTTLELEIVFYEAAVTVHDGTDPNVRRLRVYFDGYIETLPANDRTVLANDLLISDSTDDFAPPPPGVYDQASDGAAGMTGKEMRWIEQANGALCLNATRGGCTDVYQGDPGQFPADPLVTIVLDEDIVVDSDTDKNFIVTLEIGIQNLFFFDDAETDAINPLDFHFPDAVSDDGKIKAACADAPTCAANDTADFWLGEPAFTAVVTAE